MENLIYIARVYPVKNGKTVVSEVLSEHQFAVEDDCYTFINNHNAVNYNFTDNLISYASFYGIEESV